jgi:hypothetical protein
MGHREAGGEARRSRFQRLTEHRLHLCCLVVGSGALVGGVAHHEQSECGVPDVRGEVHRGAVALDGREVLRERGEVPVHQDLALALARHLKRLAVVGAFLFPPLERQRLLLLATAGHVQRLLLLAMRRRRGARELIEALALLGLEGPERVEAAVEGRDLFDAGDQAGAQREVHLLAVHQVDHLEGPRRVHQLRDRPREARSAQRLAEAERRGQEVAGSGHVIPIRSPRPARSA